MAITVPRNARELALDVLVQGDGQEGFINQRLDARLNAVSLSPADRRLAMELTYGVVRRQATLDSLLKLHVRRPQRQVEDELWMLLRLGAYQLVFLPGIPSHAAVHATVELTKSLRMPAWSGFANGVLRALSRVVTDEYTELPSSRGVPVGARKHRQLQEDVFPAPRQQPAAYFAAAYSFPSWLAERWQKRFPFDTLLQTGDWFNSAAPLCLRVNLLQGNREDYLSRLSEAGISAHPGQFPETIWLESSARIEQLPGFAEGLISVQDESAMRAASLLAPQPGEQILDLCAAPGGKTTHLAERMQDQGRILAVDVRADRLALVDAACTRLKLKCVETKLLPGNLALLPANEFDGVLVDVPCSNTGVLGKRPDARWRIKPQDLTELTQLQLHLIQTAASRVRSGGRLVYSTCSIEPEENQGLIRRFLADASTFHLAEEVLHEPGLPADGGYQALLRRST